MKNLPGYLLALLFLYIAISVWYDNDVHRIVHSTVFTLLAIVFAVAFVSFERTKK